MRYILDTDILSDLVRRSPRPQLLRRVAMTPAEEQATTSITVGELLYGAHRLGDEGRALTARIEDLLWQNLAILPFEGASARAYGALRADLERSGTPIGDSDTRIASIALARGLVVVTGNVKHFERVPGLRVENWLE